MRKTLLAMAILTMAAWLGLEATAQAFHNKVRTYCIGYYPPAYSYAPCGGGYPPFVYPCTFRYPKFCGFHKSCWNGRLTGGCAPRGYGYGNGGCCASTGCGGGNCYSGAGYGGSFDGSCGSCTSFCGSPIGGYGGCGGGCDGGCGSCGGGCDGGCGSYGSGGCDGGCAGGGYAGSNGGVAAVDGATSDEKILYDGPASGAPQTTPEVAPPAEPVADPSASNQQTAFRMASQGKSTGLGAGSGAYSRGLRSYFNGNMNEAVQDFDAASTAEPQNALYHYYRALAVYNSEGAEAANQWLRQAVTLERTTPVANFGKRMERVQGRARLWIEQARAEAGVGR